ncbi:esterase E4-like isoform X3 [Daktulosphaira vitifoliae]|uniref:esterase E4-like isoform X3 n=1 Tax=Daktulosphaira vitifoliae TaxID=58002 RepID=UPI0021AA0F4B|nr:esterase E4-like isoform X3 [Daktulosphaira vitifoliae]
MGILVCMKQFIIFLIICVHLITSSELEIKIKNGVLRGKFYQSRHGREYLSFTGIPYAKPPIGELRFKAPQPCEPWTNIFDATQIMKKCIQKKVGVGSEDCLYLNVYSPITNEKWLPVMVWIHGGSFKVGYGGPDRFGPKYFMDKDIIIVSINYRLGVLGFLSTEDDVITGNFGLKDQVMALKWVQENIRSFNGDPERITIFGGSAGGVSVGLHLLSSMSKGLFHRAILQSGTPLCFWAVSQPGLIRKRTEALATIAGCAFESSEEILGCLKNLSADMFIDLETKLMTWHHQAFVFKPVAEACNPKHDGFLCHHPLKELKIISDVPAIVTFTSDEGGMIVSSLYNDTSLKYPEFNKNFNRLLPLVLGYDGLVTQDNIEDIGKRVMKHYFPSNNVNDGSHFNAIKMFGDGGFVYGVMAMAYRWTAPLYVLEYAYQNQYSFNELWGSIEKPLGITHNDETTSLFRAYVLNEKELNEQDTKVSKLMINIWSHFATTGTPTINGTQEGIIWPSFNLLNTSMILRMDSDKPKITNNKFKDVYDFWNNLPILSRLHNDLTK